MGMPFVPPREGVTIHFHVASGGAEKHWALQVLPHWTEPRESVSKGLRLCVRDESGRIILCLDGFHDKSKPIPCARVFGAQAPIPLKLSRNTIKTSSGYRAAWAAIAALTDLKTINTLLVAGGNPPITRMYHAEEARGLCGRCLEDCIQPLGDAKAPKKTK